MFWAGCIQVRHRLGVDYIDAQHFIRPQMRTVVVDWMVCVQVRFQLFQDTLFLSVTLLDRFLAVSGPASTGTLMTQYWYNDEAKVNYIWVQPLRCKVIC